MFFNKNKIRVLFFPLIVVLIGVSGVYPQIKLTGDQWGTYAAGLYVVTGDIIVPEGRTMIVEPSTVIRFNRYCGLIVRGTLVCKSDLQRGIHFTSTATAPDTIDEWDGAKAPQWNGVEVKQGASAEFENVRILNSVFGMKVAAQSQRVELKDVMFFNNEQDFSIDDSTVYVEAGRPFNYVSVLKAEEPALKAPEKIIASPDTMVPVEKKRPPKPTKVREPWKTPVRLTLGGIAIAGVAAGVVCHLKAEQYREQYPTAGEDATEIRNKGNNLYMLRNVYIGGGAAGAAGLTITFFF